MAIQGKNAANAGDILKHSLICDVLQKCIADGWENITYAETHAGAGIYSSTVQPKEPKSKAHIINLKSNHEKLNGKAKDHYWEILDTFWQVEGNHTIEETKYAGSAYLATSILKATNEKFDIRLTEYDPILCNRLKASLTKFLRNDGFNFEDGTHIQQAGFQEKIGWLTANDNLVLIIDPFNLSLDSEGINKGSIDLYHLLKLTESVKDKTKAVVGFWYPTDQNSNQLGLPKFFDQTITKNYGELNCRKYFRGIYNFILIGFGEGQNIVNALPLQSELHPRWFDLEITERLFHERRNKSLLDIKNLMHLEEIYKTTIQQIIEHKTIKGLLRSIKKSMHLNDIHKATLEQIIEQIDNSEPEVANEG